MISFEKRSKPNCENFQLNFERDEEEGKKSLLSKHKGAFTNEFPGI